MPLSCAGIFKQSMGARNQVRKGLSYRPARLHCLAELVPWNRFLGSLKVKKFGLCCSFGASKFFYKLFEKNGLLKTVFLFRQRAWRPLKRGCWRAFCSYLRRWPSMPRYSTTDPGSSYAAPPLQPSLTATRHASDSSLYLYVLDL